MLLFMHSMQQRAGALILKLKLFIYSIQLESCGVDNLPWSGKSQMSRALCGLQPAHRFVQWIGVAEQTLKYLPNLLLRPRLVQPPGTRVTAKMTPRRNPHTSQDNNVLQPLQMCCKHGLNFYWHCGTAASSSFEQLQISSEISKADYFRFVFLIFFL